MAIRIKLKKPHGAPYQNSSDHGLVVRGDAIVEVRDPVPEGVFAALHRGVLVQTEEPARANTIPRGELYHGRAPGGPLRQGPPPPTRAERRNARPTHQRPAGAGLKQQIAALHSRLGELEARVAEPEGSGQQEGATDAGAGAAEGATDAGAGAAVGRPARRR